MLRRDQIRAGPLLGVEAQSALPLFAVLAAIRTALDRPRDQIRDVMTAIRQTALRLKSRPGRREIALISLENGDGEADL